MMLGEEGALCLVGNDVFSDVEMFEPYTSEHAEDTVMHQVKASAPTRSSVQCLERTLRTPLTCVETLVARQRRLQDLEAAITGRSEDGEFELTRHLRELGAHEEDIEWIFDTESAEQARTSASNDIPDPTESAYFTWRLFQRLGANDSVGCVSAKNAYTVLFAPLMSAMSPLVSVVIPYLVLRYRFKLNIPLSVFVRYVARILFFQVTRMWESGRFNTMHALTCAVSVTIYVQSLLTTFELSRNTYRVIRHICKRVDGVVSYVRAHDALLRRCASPAHRLACPPWAADARSLGSGEKLVLAKDLRGNRSGRRDELRAFLRCADEHAAYLTMVAVRRRFGMCFAEYTDLVGKKGGGSARGPARLRADAMFHICIRDPVPNTLVLNGTNCVITGPNAAGKSTTIKALLVNVVFAQTFGLACAERFTLTPFYYIHSQIHIPDVKGKQSLFEAEMFRCKAVMDVVQDTPADRKCLVVMDEMFNTTNVVEGIAGATAILNRLGSYRKCCTVITTHYIALARCPRFKAYQMAAVVETGRRPRFTYVLRRGVSRQFIAIELLKEHFDTALIDDAIERKNNLLLV